MDNEESKGGSGDYSGKEGFEASRLVSVREDQELEVVLEPFTLQKSTNPNLPSHQDSFPQSSSFPAELEGSHQRLTGVGHGSRFPGSQGHSKDMQEIPRGGREKGTAGGSAPIVRGPVRAKTIDSPTTVKALKRKSTFEAVMQEWLQNPHEEEEDSESGDIPLYQPTRQLHSGERIPAKTPSFTAEKETTVAGFEGETDSFAISKTEDSSPLPSFQRTGVSFPTPPEPLGVRKTEFTDENSEEYFSFKAKSRASTEIKPEEFSFKPGWKVEERADVGETDSVSPAADPKQDSLPAPQIDDSRGLSSHKPAVSSALMDELVRAKGTTTPPASSSTSRSFRRYKLPESHSNGLQESDISAGLGEKSADNPDRRDKKADLEGQIEPQDREFPPAAGEESQGTPLKTLLSETEPLVQGRTDSTRPVDSPDYPSTSYQLVSSASPDSRPRPRQLIKEFEGSAMRLTKESLALAAESQRKDKSDREEDASLPVDMQQKGPAEKYPHSGATKLPIERGQKATTAEKESMRSESKLKAIDRIAPKIRKREEAGKRQVEQEEDKDDRGQMWKDPNTSLDPMLDRSIAPISSSNSPPKPLVARAPKIEESKVPASAIEQALIFQEQPFVTHSDIWPLFLQIQIAAKSDPVTLETPMKSSCLTRCFRAAPIELNDTLKDQLRRIYALTEERLSENVLHLQVLMNVWKFLNKSKTDCRRYGQHWGRLGFQGTDPGKELGEMGIFGLLQLLFLASKMPDEADAILTYSRQPESTFPFAKVSLRISAITIETLRAGKLNKLIVKREEAYRTVRTK